jgi:hypothetical protein
LRKCLQKISKELNLLVQRYINNNQRSDLVRHFALYIKQYGALVTILAMCLGADGKAYNMNV